MMKPTSRKDQIIDRLLHSPGVRRVAEDTDGFRARVKAARCRVIPVAALARLFQVSRRLLWNWIKADLIKARVIDAPGMKRGVEKKEALRFLAQVEKRVKHTWLVEPRAVRSRTAVAKMIDARGKVLNWQGMTPRQFAGRAGVSVTSVQRAIRMRFLKAYLFKHRCYLGETPREPGK